MRFGMPHAGERPRLRFHRVPKEIDESRSRLGDSLEGEDDMKGQPTTRRVFIARGAGLSLSGLAGALQAASGAAKEQHEFFDPAHLPWHPAPGFGPGVWERIVSGGQDEGVTTRFVRFDPGSGRDAVATHDFWEEVYIISGTFECGGRAYTAGCVAVRP